MLLLILLLRWSVWTGASPHSGPNANQLYVLVVLLGSREFLDPQHPESKEWVPSMQSQKTTFGSLLMLHFVQRVGNAIKKGVQKVGNTIKNGVQRDGNAIKAGAQKVKNGI